MQEVCNQGDYLHYFKVFSLDIFSVQWHFILFRYVMFVILKTLWEISSEDRCYTQAKEQDGRSRNRSLSFCRFFFYIIIFQPFYRKNCFFPRIELYVNIELIYISSHESLCQSSRTVVGLCGLVITE